MSQIIEVTIARENFFHYTNEEVIEKFGMPIPTHVKIHLTDELKNKAIKMKQVMKELQLSSMKTISSRGADETHSHLELFENGINIPIACCEDFDRLFPVFDPQSFMLCIDSLNKKFHISFLYTNGHSECNIKSAGFDIA